MNRLFALAALLLASGSANAAVMTWDPATINSNFTLSNNNCTVAMTTNTSLIHIQSLQQFTGTKVYIEEQGNMFQAATGSGPWDVTNYWFRVGSGNIFGSSSVLPGGPIAGSSWANSRQLIAIDLVAKRSWERVETDTPGLWNNTPGDNPSTGTGGLDISSLTSFFMFNNITSVGENFTLYGGSLDQIYAPPTGFVALNGAQSCSGAVPQRRGASGLIQ